MKLEDQNSSYTHLVEVLKNSHCSLSEIHGMMAGYILEDKDVCFKTWSELVEDDIGLSQLPESASDQIKQVFLYTHVQLASSVHNVDLLLPASTNCFLARVKAFSDFSRGFLYGFGLSEFSHQLLEDSNVCHILDEMTQFSQVDVHNDDDSEQNLAALEHIIDYVQEQLGSWKKHCQKLIREGAEELLVN